MPTKFSQFNNGGNPITGDTIVGLRSGVNTRFNFTSSGIYALTREFTQSAHGLLLSNVVRMNGTSFTKALADTAANADVVGIVIDVPTVNTFQLLMAGYVTGFNSLIAGTVYFLSESTPGALTATAPTAVGNIRKPLFIADTTTSGFWLNYNGQQL